MPNELGYLQMPLPQGLGSQRLTKIEWSGLNYSQIIDTGALSFESNISTDETPYLTPSQKRKVYKSGYADPIGMFGFDDFLFVVYNSGGHTRIDYITSNGTVYTGDLGYASNEKRSIVKFNVYNFPTDPIGGSFTQKLLIFPDKKSMDFIITDNFTPDDMNFETNIVPEIKYAAVHLSRVFGVDDDRIYASGFNDYANWNLDTIDEQNEANAWASPAQANTRANGKFTGITAFSNHVICFKRDFTHELYNNKNPFRIQDIFAEGSIDNRSVCDVGGQLIFVGDNNVKVYTGGKPRILGHYLGADMYFKAVAGTDSRRYYLYCATEKKAHNFFVYDTLISQWSEEYINFEAVSFARTSTGMYMLGADGNIYKLDTGDFSHDWSAETDIFMGNSVDIKHVQKVQMFCDIAAGSKLDVYLLYNDEKFNPLTSHKVYSYVNTGSTSKKVPVRVVPRQTANHAFKLRINGYGYSRVYQLELFLKSGGELFK